MKTSIATVSVPGSFPEKLAAIAKAGFDGIEIFEQDFLASDLSPRAVGKMVREAGLEITLFQPFRDFEGLPEPERSRAFARAARKFELMNELGTDLMLICSSVHPKALGGVDRASADLAELGDLAARRGIRIGFEALAWGRHVFDHRDAWEIVRRADHPNIGLILDSFHTLARKIDPDTIRSIPGDRIFFVQLADAPAIDMDLLYWSRHFRNMPGEGDLDVAGFTRAVMAAGYRGPLSLEIFNDQFRGGIPNTVAADGYRSLKTLIDDVRRTEPSLGGALLPARGEIKGVEFIEFATGEADRAPLEALINAAGFHLAGKHRSKRVNWWRQGAVNLLVNTETEGLAFSSWLNHGTAVSEIALRVDDPARVASRAGSLGAQQHKAARGPSELDIPGFRGVGGSVLRLIDDASGVADLWEVDFTAAERDKPAEGNEIGLQSVDHIAQTMAYDEMLSWTLFYRAIFRANRAPMVDVADPDGLVRSQAIDAGGLRITLNGADAPRTVASRFIEDTFGSSVQHIAFSVSDIFTAAEKLSARNFPLLEIGDNYYADLEARFGLAPELAAKMRALNILYDEDAEGRFYQLYSKALPGGLFFEIVQRAERYDGYGAPNAPFRIAAQKRAMGPRSVPRR
ncbi:MAG: TIM barrel protein [Paracoccus sp. (in: a-proteobacteria)]|nr:TIM barrel protein [Paracoccus sp. (in: a-proteobacteria)]